MYDALSQTKPAVKRPNLLDWTICVDVGFQGRGLLPPSAAVTRRLLQRERHYRGTAHRCLTLKMWVTTILAPPVNTDRTLDTSWNGLTSIATRERTS